jgi:CRP/FNR family cyclic AMP-dependent transcriptional regulator
VNPAERNATRILGRLVSQDRAVSESLTIRSYEVGETVGRSRDMANSFCLVVSGRVQLFRTTRNGRRFAVAILGPGSMFGEESLLGGLQAGTYAVAMERCTLWFFSTHRALEISSTNAMFGFGLMQAMGQRLVETENRLEQLAYRTVASRLAALLLELSASDAEGEVCATHQQLADMLGTWRETISKTLQDFRRRGLVAPARRRLTLLDTNGLEMEAGVLS